MRDEVLIVIPARMASVRLPGKPLADIGGKPMIVRVWWWLRLKRKSPMRSGPQVVKQ